MHLARPAPIFSFGLNSGTPNENIAVCSKQASPVSCRCDNARPECLWRRTYFSIFRAAIQAVQCSFMRRPLPTDTAPHHFITYMGRHSKCIQSHQGQLTRVLFVVCVYERGCRNICSRIKNLQCMQFMYPVS